tara:strand:- start:128 stop:619 length:492 start_codon:yes stop_codon:yes gene_type:complete
MKKLFSLLVLFLVGCAATHIPYSPQKMTNRDSAVQIIEQVVMEQPLKHRPENVFITDEYLAFGNGISGKGVTLSNEQPFGNTASTTSLSTSKFEAKNITSRFYFNSLIDSELFKKRDWYVIQLKNEENQVVKRFYTRNLNKAEGFIDSINFMVSRSSNPFAEK